MATGEAWREWYLANREAYNAHQREYWKRRRGYVRPSPEEVRAKRVEKVRRWREAHPEITEAGTAAANSNKRAKALDQPERLTAGDILTLWERQPVCVSCGSGRGVDHVVSFADGGRNVAANLQNLCRPCNGRKENAGRALAPDHPNFERARKFREGRHRATTGIADL
jgi:5-methylcytosine-specific restriction endonuclease McrA